MVAGIESVSYTHLYKREKRTEGREIIMKHSRKINIVLVAIAAVIAYFCLIPLLSMVFTSFKGMSESISSSTLFRCV